MDGLFSRSNTKVEGMALNSFSFSNNFEKVFLKVPYGNSGEENTMELALESDGKYYQIENLYTEDFSLVGFNIYIFDPDEEKLSMYYEKNSNKELIYGFDFKCSKAAFVRYVDFDEGFTR